ncbi:sulfotransferase [Qipengyuania sp. YG27]|uniref:Sulfotransferase n=1 Tax=Qipengyuania mesophila TaxID=2867246 RepID=A0ABS7JQV5_9SPHN|nr:sulfotransferase [Qipengyuania mesophila]MBX7500025.1 sulfotransferase [Qipengyuania mesophila]
MIDARPSTAWSRIVPYLLFEGRPLTTKGQWINPLVFANYKLANRLPLGKLENPVFIIGTGRSGTTVLGKLFSVHKDAVFLNEPKALWHHAHGAEDIIGSYGAHAGRVRIDASEATPAQQRKIGKVYRWVSRMTGRSRVVDKYPELVFRIPYVTQLFPKARFVAIVRDGVDTVASVEFWSQRKSETVGEDRHDWWGLNDRKWQCLVRDIVPEHADLAPHSERLAATNNHLDRAAVEWIVSMREARAAARDFPEHVHMLGYEDLCSDSDAEIAAMLRHCDMDDDPTMRDYARSILSRVKPKTLLLDEFLVPIFAATLEAMSYESSIDRVSARPVRS